MKTILNFSMRVFLAVLAVLVLAVAIAASAIIIPLFFVVLLIPNWDNWYTEMVLKYADGIRKATNQYIEWLGDILGNYY